MNVEDAIHHAVIDYPGGATALAPRMGLQAQTLRNMAVPGQVTHGWSLRRFRQVLTFTGDRRPLQALAEENGGVFVPLPFALGRNSNELLRDIAKLAAEFGDVPRTIEDALADDGKVSANELGRIEVQILELIQAATHLQGIVRDIHERRRALPEEDRP